MITKLSCLDFLKTNGQWNSVFMDESLSPRYPRGTIPALCGPRALCSQAVPAPGSSMDDGVITISLDTYEGKTTTAKLLSGEALDHRYKWISIDLRIWNDVNSTDDMFCFDTLKENFVIVSFLSLSVTQPPY